MYVLYKYGMPLERGAHLLDAYYYGHRTEPPAVLRIIRIILYFVLICIKYCRTLVRSYACILYSVRHVTNALIDWARKMRVVGGRAR